MRLQFGTNGAAALGVNPAGAENLSTSRKPPTADNSGTLDRINLSSTSSLINRFEVSRTARIQQLTQAVQAGTYNVASHDLSARIISAALGQ